MNKLIDWIVRFNNQKPTAASDSADKQAEGIRQHERELKKLNQQLIHQQSFGAMAGEKQWLLLEAQLQAVQYHLADLPKSWKELLKRRRMTEQAFTKLKDQLPDAQINTARTRLRQGDSETAEQLFDELADKEALAAFQSGQLAEGRFDYAKAMQQYSKAVKLDQDNPDYLLAAGKLARRAADYEQAQEWLEHLRTLREAEGKNSLNFARAVHELAVLYALQKKHLAAEPLYKRSLEILEQVLGKEHPDVAAVLNNLAELYRQQERYSAAEPLYRRSLEIKEQTLGKDHSSVATTMNNLALLYDAQGRYEDAELLYKYSLEIKEQVLGKDHSSVATTLNNLALLYDSQGRYVEAELLYKRCLAILQEKLATGHEHIKTLELNYLLMQLEMAGTAHPRHES